MEANETLQTKKILKKVRELSLLLDNEKAKLKQDNLHDIVLKLHKACILVEQSITELENYEQSQKREKTPRNKINVDVSAISSITVNNFLIDNSYSVNKFFEDILFPEYVSDPDNALKRLSLTDFKFMYYLLTGIQIKGKVTKTEVFNDIKSYLDNQRRTKTML